MQADLERRAAELAGSLAAVRHRLTDACRAAGRDPRDVTLVAVTKTYPASDVAALARLGVVDLGESKDQEASAKIRELGTGQSDGRRWHLIGRLQTNKARSVAAYAYAVHSVDRPGLVRALDEAVIRVGRPPLEVYVQVSDDGDPARGGASATEVPSLAAAIANSAGLRLAGLMTVPPLGADADAVFDRLQQLSARLRIDHPDAVGLSAGMSGDLESAVAHGSTLVRVGTALLGRRGQVFS